ncbi:unnamed protein product [Knipowitschia caucasica]
MSALQVLPCTVSQLLGSSLLQHEAFAIGDLELHQVSVVGIVRSSCPCATYNQFCVDDMTGPPLTVRQWTNTDSESSDPLEPEPGVYVKVHGSLRELQGQKSLMAMRIRRVSDLNEITSHMLEVVYAHQQLFGKGCDVNMNVLPQTHKGSNTAGFSIVQGQVLHVIQQHSGKSEGIHLQDLVTLLDYINETDIRKSLAFLTNEGHVFSTIDDNHFKSTEC